MDEINLSSNIYQQLWFTFNQRDFKPLKKELPFDQLGNNYFSIKEYFENNSNYKLIDLKLITKDEDNYLLEKSISSRHLLRNFKKTLKFRSKWYFLNPRKFQIEAVKDKYINVLCPFTGKNIKSNQSLFVNINVIAYRFVSEEVFYLIVSGVANGFVKSALYFPKNELVVRAFGSFETADFNELKARVVSNYNICCDYVNKKDSDSKKVVIVIGFYHFAHHLWNELSGLYRLYTSKYLDEIDKFLILREPLGDIQEIFPEIPIHKIERKQNNHEIFEEIIKNDYFVVRVGDNFIKNDLADRVYKVAIKNCHSETLDKVKQVKNNYFPLLWISIRVGSRTWVEQVSGLSKLIDSLALEFPKLGVVFDGFSLPGDSYIDISSKNLSYPKDYSDIVERENEVVNDIVSNLSPSTKIGIFNTIGCSIFETNVWAHVIDIYLTHHGTLQHKVGWLANKPGIVHSNSKILKNPRHYIWTAREYGIKPQYINYIDVNDISKQESVIYREVNDLDQVGDGILIKVKKSQIGEETGFDDYQVDWTVLSGELRKVIKFIERNGKLWKLSIMLEHIKRQSRRFIQNSIRIFDFSKI